MFEKAFHGGRKYWTVVAILAAIVGVGAIFYLWQLKVGLKDYGHE
ncbi:MAG: hypothetical protein KCCBMMGE_01879 [Candidatus Methanoperedenaceae archaeon GB37]|nr:hypothetical protein DMNBHIDG_02845 [Candidatus Methanoperedenaceae archaeon GB37]CAD7783468.1 MAG: hypothetical protein KCCBMMGE_01879 [Candidatus Methanoperedenaceae archaeon GB37]